MTKTFDFILRRHPLHKPHAENNPRTTQQSLQDLDAICKYANQWAITLNADKTIQQTSSYRAEVTVQTTTPRLTFGGLPIPVVAAHKYP